MSTGSGGSSIAPRWLGIAALVALSAAIAIASLPGTRAPSRPLTVDHVWVPGVGEVIGNAWCRLSPQRIAAEARIVDAAARADASAPRRWATPQQTDQAVAADAADERLHHEVRSLTPSDDSGPAPEIRAVKTDALQDLFLETIMQSGRDLPAHYKAAYRWAYSPAVVDRNIADLVAAMSGAAAMPTTDVFSRYRITASRWLGARVKGDHATLMFSGSESYFYPRGPGWASWGTVWQLVLDKAHGRWLLTDQAADSPSRHGA
jgi:hypothetical protein